MPVVVLHAVVEMETLFLSSVQLSKLFNIWSKYEKYNLTKYFIHKSFLSKQLVAELKMQNYSTCSPYENKNSWLSTDDYELQIIYVSYIWLLQGKSPQGACEMVIDEIVQRIGKQFEISIIAVNMKVNYILCVSNLWSYFQQTENWNRYVKKLSSVQVSFIFIVYNMIP